MRGLGGMRPMEFERAKPNEQADGDKRSQTDAKNLQGKGRVKNKPGLAIKPASAKSETYRECENGDSDTIELLVCSHRFVFLPSWEHHPCRMREGGKARVQGNQARFFRPLRGKPNMRRWRVPVHVPERLNGTPHFETQSLARARAP
ncbi:MAG: hypothetical protein JWM16_1356 [Verrucomicrobiales bacterium]|nr:hypothetical protein [Verrucomicrobiales bacterium]